MLKISLKTLLAVWFEKVFSTLVPFITLPIIIESLTPASYSQWIFISAVASLLPIFDVAPTSSIFRIASRFSNDQRRMVVCRYSLASLLFSIPFCLISSLLLLLTFYILRLYELPFLSEPLLVVVLASTLSLSFRVSYTIFAVNNKQALFNSISSLFLGLKFFSIIFLYKTSHLTLYTLCLTTGVCLFLDNFVSFCVATRYLDFGLAEYAKKPVTILAPLVRIIREWPTSLISSYSLTIFSSGIVFIFSDSLNPLLTVYIGLLFLTINTFSSLLASFPYIEIPSFLASSHQVTIGQLVSRRSREMFAIACYLPLLSALTGRQVLSFLLPNYPLPFISDLYSAIIIIQLMLPFYAASLYLRMLNNYMSKSLFQSLADILCSCVLLILSFFVRNTNQLDSAFLFSASTCFIATGLLARSIIPLLVNSDFPLSSLPLNRLLLIIFQSVPLPPVLLLSFYLLSSLLPLSATMVILSNVTLSILCLPFFIQGLIKLRQGS